MEVISGHDERDSTSLAEPAEAYGQQLDSPLAGVRVGVISSLIASHGVSAETRAAVDRAAGSLRQLGATLVDIELPHADYAVATYYLIAPSEASSNLARYDGAHYGYRAQLAGSEASLIGGHRARLAWGPQAAWTGENPPTCQGRWDSGL